jgi:hypothetical protein
MRPARQCRSQKHPYNLAGKPILKVGNAARTAVRKCGPSGRTDSQVHAAEVAGVRAADGKKDERRAGGGGGRLHGRMPGRNNNSAERGRDGRPQRGRSAAGAGTASSQQRPPQQQRLPPAAGITRSRGADGRRRVAAANQQNPPRPTRTLPAAEAAVREPRPSRPPQAARPESPAPGRMAEQMYPEGDGPKDADASMPRGRGRWWDLKRRRHNGGHSGLPQAQTRGLRHIAPSVFAGSVSLAGSNGTDTLVRPAAPRIRRSKPQDRNRIKLIRYRSKLMIPLQID